jgi:hypothetical protein
MFHATTDPDRHFGMRAMLTRNSRSSTTYDPPEYSSELEEMLVCRRILHTRVHTSH